MTEMKTYTDKIKVLMENETTVIPSTMIILGFGILIMLLIQTALPVVTSGAIKTEIKDEAITVFFSLTWMFWGLHNIIIKTPKEKET
jgi:hypothetical protein